MYAGAPYAGVPYAGGPLPFVVSGSVSATAADLPTTIDTVTRTVVVTRTAFDLPQITDTLARTEALSRITADLPTTIDAITRTESLFRTVSDAPVTTDSLVRTEVLIRTASDLPTITDAVIRTQVLTRTNSDSPATTDSLIGTSGAHVMTDSPHTADTVLRIVTLNRTASDTPQTIDNLVRTEVLARAASDSPSTADTISRIETLTRTAADSCFTVDTVVRTTVLSRVASDLPHTTDTLSASVSSGVRTLSDSPATTDFLAINLVMFRSASDLPHTADQLDTDAGIVPDATPDFVPFRYYVPSFSFTGRSSQNTDIQKVLGATPAQIIRSCLIDFGLVTYPIKPPGTWPCYAFSMPDGPDDAICVYDVVGKLFGRGARTGKNNVHPGVQVTVRGSDELQGYLKAQNIANAFDTNFPVITIAPEDHQTHNIMSIYRVSPIMTLGEEIGKRRYLWTLDVRVAFEYDEPSLG